MHADSQTSAYNQQIKFNLFANMKTCTDDALYRFDSEKPSVL